MEGLLSTGPTLSSFFESLLGLLLQGLCCRLYLNQINCVGELRSEDFDEDNCLVNQSMNLVLEQPPLL